MPVKMAALSSNGIRDLMATTTSTPTQPQGADCSNAQTGSAIVTILQNLVAAVNSLSSSLAKKPVTGTFTLTAAATITVPNASVLSGSVIALTATNAAAATLMGSVKSLYISAISPGVSFTVATANGVAAGGSEAFSYTVT
jgi:hypothetical protein